MLGLYRVGVGWGVPVEEAEVACVLRGHLVRVSGRGRGRLRVRVRARVRARVRPRLRVRVLRGHRRQGEGPPAARARHHAAAAAARGGAARAAAASWSRSAPVPRLDQPRAGRCVGGLGGRHHLGLGLGLGLG